VFGLPDGSRLAAALGPRRLRLVARAEAPVLSLEGGWESVYRRRTSSRRRSLHRRRRRQLADLGRAETVVARTPAEVGPALRDAVRLHAARRHGRLDGSGFSTPPGGFQQPALLALARRDRTRIVTLQLDGRPIAYHCYLAFADAMYVHSLAFDPAYGRWSPGVVTTLDAIAHAASEGLRRVEFLGGGERYKLELADGIAPMHQGIGLAHGLHGRVAVAANHGRIALRLHAKRSPVLRRVYTDGLAPVRRARARRAAENATREDAA